RRCEIVNAKIDGWNAKKRGMPQLDRVRQGLIESYKDRKLEEHWPAASEGVYLLLPKQLHGGLIDGRLVIFMFFLEFRDLGLNFLHPFHGFHALVGEEDNIPAIVVSPWNLDPRDREAGVAKSQECDEIFGNNVQYFVITVKKGA